MVMDNCRQTESPIRCTRRPASPHRPSPGSPTTDQQLSAVPVAPVPDQNSSQSGAPLRPPSLGPPLLAAQILDLWAQFSSPLKFLCNQIKSKANDVADSSSSSNSRRRAPIRCLQLSQTFINWQMKCTVLKCRRKLQNPHLECVRPGCFKLKEMSPNLTAWKSSNHSLSRRLLQLNFRRQSSSLPATRMWPPS